jgi:RHS repeat-associated protein
MTLPTFGTIYYSYANFQDSTAAPTNPHITRMTSTMTTPDGQWTFSPAVTVQCPQPNNNCQQTITVTKPSYNGRTDKAVYKTVVNGGAWPIETDYYTGSISSTNLVATQTGSYDLSHPCSYSGAPYYICAGAVMSVTKIAETTTLPIPSATNINQTTQFCYDLNYGNLLYKWEWNFYTGAIVHDPNPPSTCSLYSGATPDRTTTITYLGGSNYISNTSPIRNIANRPLSITVTNSSGGIVSKTLNSYDGGTLVTTGATGVAGHDDTNFGSSFIYRGNLTQIQRLVSGTSYVTKSLTYDITGQLRTETDWTNTNTTTYSYADNFFNDAGDTSNPSSYTPSQLTNAYLTKITFPTVNSITQTDTFGYYWGTGQKALSTDANGRTTYFHFYDPLDRPTSAKLPDGGWTYSVYPNGSETQVDTGVGITSTTLSINCPIASNACRHDQVRTDNLGRATSRILVSDPDGQTTVNTASDSNGRVYSTSNPHRSGSSPTDGIESYAYDGLDRKTQVIHPDSSIAYTYYGATVGSNGGRSSQLCSGVGYPVLHKDEAAKVRQTWTDGFGRVIEADEPDSANTLNVGTCYSYDLNDNLLSVVQNGSRQRTFTYDLLSRLLTASNPESGTICYGTYSAGVCQGNGYDANNNLIYKTDARNITTTYSYDALNRLSSKTYSDSTPPVTLTYDVAALDGLNFQNPVGRLVKTTGGDARKWQSYDPLGRVATWWQCMADYCATGNVRGDRVYNLAGGVTSYTGMGVTFTQTIDSADRVTQITSNFIDPQHPATLATVDPSVGFYPNGPIRKMTLGNGLTDTTVYNPRFQPCRIDVNSSGTALSQCSDTPPAGNVLDLSFNWNAGVADNGNLAGAAAAGQRTFSRTYGYDNLNRLTSMSSPADPSGCLGLSWTYDPWGNRTDQTVTAGTCGTSHVTVNTANRLVGPPYQYDANGNLSNDGSHTYTYDAENRITQVDGGTTATYVYDANGQRVRKLAGGVTIDYVYDSEGKVSGEIWTPPGYFTVGYIYLNGQLVAEYKDSTTYFMHSDHLGSTRLMTNLSGGVYDSLDYLPFGEQIAGGTGTTHKFTGKERDGESSLDDFGARYYSSQYARWMSVDPAYESEILELPQTWNRYSYVYNRPTFGTDPDGRCPPCVGAVIGGLVEGGWNLGSQLVHNGYSLAKVNRRELVANVVSGAITGAVAGSTGGASLVLAGSELLGEATFGAGLSVVGGEIKRDLAGQDTTLGDVATDAVAGFVGGGIGHVAADLVHVPNGELGSRPAGRRHAAAYDAAVKSRGQAFSRATALSTVGGSTGTHFTEYALQQVLLNGQHVWDWVTSSSSGTASGAPNGTVTVKQTVCWENENSEFKSQTCETF